MNSIRLDLMNMISIYITAKEINVNFQDCFVRVMTITEIHVGVTDEEKILLKSHIIIMNGISGPRKKLSVGVLAVDSLWSKKLIHIRIPTTANMYRIDMKGTGYTFLEGGMAVKI